MNCFCAYLCAYIRILFKAKSLYINIKFHCKITTRAAVTAGVQRVGSFFSLALSCLSTNHFIDCVLLAMDSEIDVKPKEISASGNKPGTILTNYVKRVVLDYLKENGCTRANLETTAHARRHSSQQIIGK